jgi:hypothetical protein
MLERAGTNERRREHRKRTRGSLGKWVTAALAVLLAVVVEALGQPADYVPSSEAIEAARLAADVYSVGNPGYATPTKLRPVLPPKVGTSTPFGFQAAAYQDDEARRVSAYSWSIVARIFLAPVTAERLLGSFRRWGRRQSDHTLNRRGVSSVRYEPWCPPIIP